MKAALFLIFLSTFLASEHPIYVSVAEIHYKPKTARIEIGLKIFADDLEHTLEQLKGETIEIATKREHPKATKYINEYLKRHLKFSIDQQELSYKYVGREVDGGDFFAIWVYLLIEEVPKNAQNLHVKNSLLIDFFETQNNIVTFRKGENIKRYSLYDGHTSANIPLN